eukprot:1287854-Amphidinium_carterae.1
MLETVPEFSDSIPEVPECEFLEGDWQESLEAHAFTMQARKEKGRQKGKSQKPVHMFQAPSSSSQPAGPDGSNKSPQMQQERSRRLAALKAKTRCLACGQYGHWSGDKACLGSKKGSSQ